MPRYKREWTSPYESTEWLGVLREVTDEYFDDIQEAIRQVAMDYEVSMGIVQDAGMEELRGWFGRMHRTRVPE